MKPDNIANDSYIGESVVSEATAVYISENTTVFDFDSYIANLPVIDLSSENAVYPGSASDWDW